MSVDRSGPLAAWANAWLAGRVGIDQVVDAVTGRDARHAVTGLPDGPTAGALTDLLIAWRRDGGPVRCVLPEPGDVRGLAGPAAHRAAALTAGESVGTAGLGAVPHVVVHAPSSNPTSVTWQVFDLAPVPDDHRSVPDAQYDLTTAVRGSAAELAQAQVTQTLPGDGDALHDARRAGERLNLPPGHPQPAVSLLAQAQRIDAVVRLAADPLGGAVDRTGARSRDEALRPLALAARRARIVAYNAVADRTRR